ncbi:MAG: transketolase [Candidatus Omnitrophota bacterium]
MDKILSKKKIDGLKERAKRVRLSILELVSKTASPHIGPSFSITEVLVALYFEVLNVDPKKPDNPLRDRFLLSKGHACPALYAVLAERGFISKKELEGFAVDDGVLQQHPDRDLKHGIECSSGSLGHGLSVGSGMALAGKTKGENYRVYVLMGDGELNEGSVWETALFAGQHKLNDLIAIVDHNKMQAMGNNKDIIGLDPLKEKWESFGWEVREADGHDFAEVIKTFRAFSSKKPKMVILHTVKGKGVPFMENELLWHYRYPREGEEYDSAVKELRG